MPLPRFQPLSLGRRLTPFNDADYLFELKWDGFRSLVHVEHGRCSLVSRKQNQLKAFSSLNAAIADELRKHSVVLDGEIVCLDAEGKPQFYDLLFRRGEPKFCAFDVLWCDGEDLRYAPLIERKQRLRALLHESDRVFFCDHIEQQGELVFDWACQNDLEGIVAKRKIDPYLPGTTWLKIRNPAYSQWAGRSELFERERERDPDVQSWDTCALACEGRYE